MTGRRTRLREDRRERLLGVATLAVAAVITYLSIIAINGIPFSDPYRLQAEFPPSAPLLKDGDEVRIGGQRAGQVREVRRGPHGGALVVMDLDTGPIGRDARAAVRLRGLAGAVYVEVQPGDPRRPLPEGATIAPDRTEAGLKLTDVIDAFGPSTTAALRTSLDGYGTGLAGRGGDLNRALGDLPAALDDATPLLRAATRDPGALAGLLAGMRHTVRGFAPPGSRALGAMLPHASAVLSTLAGHAGSLETSIALLRPLADRAAVTLPEADRLLRAARPAVRSLTPGVRALLAALPDVDALLARRAALTSLSRLAGSGAPVLRMAAPVVRDLAPSAAALAPAAASTDALSAFLAPYGSDLYLGPQGFREWGGFSYPDGQAPGARAVRFAPVFTCLRARTPYPAPGAALQEEQPCR